MDALVDELLDGGHVKRDGSTFLDGLLEECGTVNYEGSVLISLDAMVRCGEWSYAWAVPSCFWRRRVSPAFGLLSMPCEGAWSLWKTHAEPGRGHSASWQCACGPFVTLRAS